MNSDISETEVHHFLYEVLINTYEKVMYGQCIEHPFFIVMMIKVHLRLFHLSIFNR